MQKCAKRFGKHNFFNVSLPSRTGVVVDIGAEVPLGAKVESW